MNRLILEIIIAIVAIALVIEVGAFIVATLMFGRFQ